MLAAVVWCTLVLAPVASGATETRPPGPDVSAGGLRGPVQNTCRPAVREPVSPAAGPRGVLGADDELLEALAGSRGGNRLVVCACRTRPGAAPRGPCLPQRCPAVVWRRRWALVRATCVADLSLADMTLLRTTAHERTCDALEQDELAKCSRGPSLSVRVQMWSTEPALMAERVRRAVWGRVQPLWRDDGRYDVALLELNRPFMEDDPPANFTTANRCLQDIKYWMQNIEEGYWDSGHENKYVSSTTGYTLFMAGILPATTFLVFFLLVTFGTGTPIQVPYSNEKDGIKTPWMIHGYSSDVKCFPTYGQV